MRGPLTGLLLVVGGHSRRVGKTRLIEAVLRAHAHEDWTAIKISAHRHAPEGTSVPPVEESFARSYSTQTGRFLLAGGRRAFLVRAPEPSMPEAVALVTALRSAGSHVIVESNRIARHLLPDLLLFVVDPFNADWKQSAAACLAKADAIVSEYEVQHATRVRDLIPPRAIDQPLFMTGDPFERCRCIRWIGSLLRDRRRLTESHSLRLNRGIAV
jgi:hypothetical protein